MSKPTAVERAIRDAVEGGWEQEQIKALAAKYPAFKIIVHVTDWGGRQYLDGSFGQYSLGDIFLDPLFWQSLGKALGWEKNTSKFPQFSPAWEIDAENARTRWIDNWHYFIDNLAEGKDAESFFANL